MERNIAPKILQSPSPSD